ncbi:histidine phosphatase family protein [Ectobacillus antri]|uniref:Histidine phosphatase family protein n=1 Tax=Ectobacillus antri TaxID=2486280 RepID=A0ABT6H209_9BACI|nr:histidine phosphatase family protein [Ectobacillus antri]MDG4655811.1 histidine phosphatase family protein [Ectobacillus antri]MDG5752486.1 histidine phosphatase family protein [Ectobacillus antri]
MTEICLVRHGQTDWNFKQIIQGREDIPLNTVGKKQAEQSASFLSQEKWDVIISSPLLRAKETASLIQNAAGIPELHLDERFIERDFGSASGRPVAEVREQIAKGEVADMETDEQLVERCFSALCDVAKKHKGKRIIIVAHSHAIKAILHAIHPQEIHFKTPLQNACANYVALQDKAWHVRRYNVAEHIV